MKIAAFLPIVAAMIVLPAHGQTKMITLGPNRIELSVERETKSGWKTVDPGYIFNAGDHVRFRFKTNFKGFVYVMNQGTAGTYTKLFPREDTGLMNKIDGGKEYTVPATEGAFRIDGPPGQDIIYWMLTPVSIGGDSNTHSPLPSPPPARTGKLPEGMTPRCDDTILRARGECVDSSAGPQAVQNRELIPENIKPLAEANDQELVFMKKQKTSVVSSPVPLNGPVIYEFRLAHK